MKKIRLGELSEAGRSFLDQVLGDEPVMVEDDQGPTRDGVIPYDQAAPEEIAAANASLERLRAKSSQAMREADVTEADIDRVLLEDD